MKDDGHFVLVDGNTGLFSNKQTELKEPMLCSSCEGLMSRHEAYIKSKYDMWLKFERPRKIDPRSKKVSANNVDLPKFFEIDYTHLKLFTLACIWRAAESSFKSYRMENDRDPLGQILPSIWKEKIRKVLLSDDPGPDYNFPILPTLDSTGMLANATTLGIEYLSIKPTEFVRTFVGGALWTVALSEGNKGWTSIEFKRLQSNNRCFFNIRDLCNEPGFARIINAAPNTEH